jgi:Mn2+/Fe2+ NRAMP family transporter
MLVANTINIAADIGAMGDATKLLIGGWSPLYVVIYAGGSVTAQIFLSYKRYSAILKWLTLVLFAYVIALAIVHVPWGAALSGLLIPKVQFNGAFLSFGHRKLFLKLDGSERGLQLPDFLFLGSRDFVQLAGQKGISKL